jgi:hypothetical protein
MVVFGAGASYDSSSSFPLDRYPGNLGQNPYNDFDRPPLANQLFEDRPFFVRARAKFPKCLAVVPYLQGLSRDVNVEHELETLQKSGDPEAPKQLAAIRSYLELRLWECEVRWKNRTQGVTNYSTLLNQIRQWKNPNDEVCLVTFNYDTLLEDALPKAGLRPLTLPDFVTTDYKIIKLHGSIDWAHEAYANVTSISTRQNLDVANDLIEMAPRMVANPLFEIVREHPIAKSGYRPLIPAIAIPVETKTKTSYECPKEHIDSLEKCLPKVSKLLLIGWRGSENDFVKSLAQKVTSDAKMMIVSSSAEKANEVAKKIQNAGGRAQDVGAANHGFTNFVIAREAEKFLRS